MSKPNLRPVNPPDDEDDRSPERLWQRADELRPKRLTWLLPSRLPSGSISILEGDKGVSKSTFAAGMVAALTKGKAFLGRKKSKPLNVLWLAGEEDATTMVQPRLLAAGADLTRVIFPTEDENGKRLRFMFPSMLPQLHDAVSYFNAALVVVDPLSAFVPPDADLRNDQAIHSILDPLSDLAHATGATILLTRNLTKDTTAARHNRGLGGSAVAGVARAVMVIDWPDRRCTRRVLRVVSCNLTCESPAVEYDLDRSGEWPTIKGLKEISPTADTGDDDLLDPGERDVRADAKKLLRSLLASGWVSVTTIEGEALSASIGSRTLRAAKAELHVRSRRVGSTSPPRWEWSAPVGGFK